MGKVILEFDIPEEFNEGEALLIGADALEDHGFTFFADTMREAGEALSLPRPKEIKNYHWKPAGYDGKRTHLFPGGSSLAICGSGYTSWNKIKRESDFSELAKKPLCKLCLAVHKRIITTGSRY